MGVIHFVQLKQCRSGGLWHTGITHLCLLLSGSTAMEGTFKEVPSGTETPIIPADDRRSMGMNYKLEVMQEVMVIDPIKVETPALFVATTMIPTTIQISDDEEEDSAHVLLEVVPKHVAGLEDDPPGGARRLDSEEIERLTNGKLQGGDHGG